MPTRSSRWRFAELLHNGRRLDWIVERFILASSSTHEMPVCMTLFHLRPTVPS